MTPAELARARATVCENRAAACRRTAMATAGGGATAEGFACAMVELSISAARADTWQSAANEFSALAAELERTETTMSNVDPNKAKLFLTDAGRYMKAGVEEIDGGAPNAAADDATDGFRSLCWALGRLGVDYKTIQVGPEPPTRGGEAPTPASGAGLPERARQETAAADEEPFG